MHFAKMSPNRTVIRFLSKTDKAMIVELSLAKHLRQEHYRKVYVFGDQVVSHSLIFSQLEAITKPVIV